MSTTRVLQKPSASLQKIRTQSLSSPRLRLCPPPAPTNGSRTRNTTGGTSRCSPTRCTNAARISAKTRDGFPSALASPRPLWIPRRLPPASAPTVGTPTLRFPTIKATRSHSTALCTTAATAKNAKMRRTCRGVPQAQETPKAPKTTRHSGFPSGPVPSFSTANAPTNGSPGKNTTWESRSSGWIRCTFAWTTTIARMTNQDPTTRFGGSWVRVPPHLLLVFPL